LYSNTLLSGNEGEIKLQTLMKNAHPSVRYDTNISTILKDFAKIYLQEVL
jgi:phenylacetate-coenzyme A ligase PaaK-like adenylate-forming protein